ncbi:ROK family protein [Candidatus Magnetominusculus xianensis]|uniref:Glucokinase n=1 Tax=Candidatus Magnetominusculus xianensis TaxID=1748249 RepID=A0ABR5SEW4_9BACT|nr:ROK family protein [Candidatus Magnetominusculus xianensis]KWT82487.1 glucokinase [Candidatus Magnetominusculus xianensis]MBF0403207.1 ROK family protein [Nitrospirota bacterium]
MSKPFSIGVDLGGTNLRVAVVSREGEIVDRITVSSTGNVIESLIGAIERLFSDKINGIGLAVAGLTDGKKILSSPNLPILKEIDFVGMLQSRFNTPVYLGNDASVAALGESISGAGKDMNTFVMLTLGTGIGGGVVYNRRLLNIAGELGHVIVEPGGRLCGCGGKGCLEAYASARAMSTVAMEAIELKRDTMMTQYGSRDIMPADIYKYALEGDPLAIEIFKTAGFYLGIGIANYINIFGPDAIILMGGLIGAWDIYVKKAIKTAATAAFKELYAKTAIIPSKLGGDAGIIGAAELTYC